MELKPLQVETGIIFGQECYLDPARAREFLAQVNAIFPNFFTRYNYRQLPNQFVLGNSNGTKRCIVQLNRFSYFMQETTEPDIFLHEVEKIFDCFRNLFVLNDVRRIGKIYDLQLPANFKRNSLSNILRIEESVQVNNLQLLFTNKGKNINIHFLPVETETIEVGDKRINIESEVAVHCDINNIDMSSSLNIPETFKEVFGFTDRYVQTELVNFLNKYFGDTP